MKLRSKVRASSVFKAVSSLHTNRGVKHVRGYGTGQSPVLKIPINSSSTFVSLSKVFHKIFFANTHLWLPRWTFPCLCKEIVYG